MHKQKSRDLTVTLGDNSTAYFFGLMKERRARYKISCLLDSSGATITDMEVIGATCVEYYKNLYSP
ncbi:hypothetical protein FRX31_015251, partial [Thalictrum thalictroides]